MFARHTPRLRGALKAIATSIFLISSSVLSSCSAAEAPHWQAVNADILVGEATRLEVRLVGADATGVTVTATSGLTEDEIRRMVEESKDYLVEQKRSEDFERQRQHAVKLIEETEALFPRVEPIISTSDHGLDAVRKARAILERAKSAVGAGDMGGLGESVEALNRTLTMFRGVVSKTSRPAHGTE